MHKPSFLAGTLLGAVTGIALVAGFPRLMPQEAATPPETREPLQEAQPEPRPEPVAETPVAPAAEKTADNPFRKLWNRRVDANEMAAIATLRNITSAQAQLQASGVIDVNRNGVGEYGGFAEMSGEVDARGADQPLNPPVLSNHFRRVIDGCVDRSGYRFAIYLAGKECAPVAERDGGGFDAKKIDAPMTEVVWCAYAWPVKAGATGRRTFFVNQAGDILSTDAEYSAESPPAPLSAFAAGSKGLDGIAGWTPVR